MNSVQSYFLISLLLITALISIICLLILATDQPDAMMEGQRRIVLTPTPKFTSTSATMPPMSQKMESSREWQTDEASDGRSQEKPSLPPPSLPMEVILKKMTEFDPLEGGKFMSLAMVLDEEFNELLLLAKDDGRIEVRDSTPHQRNGTLGPPVRRIIRLPTKIYRLRPLNASTVAVLEADFSRLQVWDLASGQLKAERQMAQPAKDIAVQGNILFALGRFDGRVEAFDLANGLRPMAAQVRIGEHCQSLARTDRLHENSLLLACPSGLLQISYPDGQVLRSFNNQSSQGMAISAVQVISEGSASLVMAASRIQRELLIFDWSGTLRSKLRENRREEQQGLWLWTALAMFGDKVYALDYIRNRVEIFQVEGNIVL